MRGVEGLALCLLGACAREAAEVVRAEDLPGPAVTSGSAAVSAVPQPARLTRAVLDEAVRAGLGNFLATVQVSPAFARGRFAGWRLDGARNLPRWHAAGLDLRVGDVVTAVNGGPLERPDEALAVFNALRGAGELRVEVVRAQRPLTLRVAVE